MIIYLIRNTVNGKCYVGKTSRSLSARWHEHLRDARNRHRTGPLYDDLSTYQRHCFETEVLSTAKDSRRLAQLERKFIRIFHAVESGYNRAECSFGGRIRKRRAVPSAPRSPEQKLKIASSVRRAWLERKEAA